MSAERSLARALSLWTLLVMIVVASVGGFLLFAQFDQQTRQLLGAEAIVVRTIVGEAAQRHVPLASSSAQLEEELRPHGLRFALFSASGSFLAGDARLHGPGIGGAVLPDMPSQRQVSFVSLPGGYAILATSPRATFVNRLTTVIPFAVGLLLALAVRLRAPHVVARVLRSEEDLRERERHAGEERMRRLLADASHEMRTPLAVLRGYFGVLARGAILDATLAERILGTMEAEVARLAALVDSLLRLARIEGQAAHGIVERVDARALVDEVTTRLAPAGNGRLTTELEDAVIVNIDANELRDAVTNVVDNALKYAPAGPVVVRVRRDGGSAAISVADAGPGIAASERADVFERFFRGSNRGDVAGSGLGLAIVKRVAERGHGSVAIDDTPGGGSTVTIRLPLAGSP